MSKALLHTPVGVRDIYGKECAVKLTIENNINKDNTWNKDSFMLMMSNLVNKYDEKHKLSPEIKKQIELQPFNNTFERPNVVKHGFNPALLQLHM